MLVEKASHFLKDQLIHRAVNVLKHTQVHKGTVYIHTYMLFQIYLLTIILIDHSATQI